MIIRKRLNKLLALVMSIGIVLGGVSVMPAVPVYAAEIDIASSFPDETFRNHVSTYFDTNGDGKLSDEEISNATYLSLGDVQDITGIEKLTNLKELYCMGTAYSGISDKLGNLPKLEILYLQGCNVTALNLDNNTSLKGLYILKNDNKLNVDVSKLAQLEKLELDNCISNTTLDLSANTALKELNCRDNNLQSLNINNCSNLERVSCGGAFTTLYTSNLSKLKYLKCGGNLTSLSLSNNKDLEYLDCSSCKLTGLDLTGLSMLKDVECYSNQLTSITLDGCSSLERVQCGSNNLSSINGSGCVNLKELYCYFNPLTSINISSNTALTKLTLSNTNLSGIDVSNNKALCFIAIDTTNITSLDVTGTALENVPIYHAVQAAGETGIVCNEKVVIKGNKNYVKPDTNQNNNTSKNTNSNNNNNTSKNNTGSSKSTSSTKYSNEWVNGKWYNKDGSQTYKGTMKWKSNSKGWWIEDSAGWYPTSQWQKIDGKWYYFCADGYMDYSEYRDGCWLGSDGAWDENYSHGAWHSNSKGWWYEDNGWYPVNQWVWIDGVHYYFGGTGYWNK